LTQAKAMKVASTLGWAAIALAVILMLFSGANRLGQMTLDPVTASELDVRYIQHPWVSLLHIVPGVLFLTLAPLQFVARIRRRRISIHRGLGRILATCAAISGVIVLVLNVVFPAFGGISTQTATAFFGVIFLFSLAMAIRHILRKEVRQHREWMIRTFALAVGVATVRVFFLLLGAMTGLSFEETFGASFWLGFGVNLVVAEVWINYTRASSRSAEGGNKV
jgi:uncharacterized membrane protein YqgA involved in biofilm formation